MAVESVATGDDGPAALLTVAVAVWLASSVAVVRAVEVAVSRTVSVSVAVRVVRAVRWGTPLRGTPAQRETMCSWAWEMLLLRALRAVLVARKLLTAAETEDWAAAMAEDMDALTVSDDTASSLKMSRSAASRDGARRGRRRRIFMGAAQMHGCRRGRAMRPYK